MENVETAAFGHLMLTMPRMKFRLLPSAFALATFLLLAQTTEVEITAEPHHHQALENAYVRAFKVEVLPHQDTLMHWHRHDYFFVSLGNSQIENDVKGKPPATLKLQDGETRFTPGNFAHVAKNLADTPSATSPSNTCSTKKPARRRLPNGTKNVASTSSTPARRKSCLSKMACAS